MVQPGPQMQVTPPRRGMSPWAIVLIVLGSCLAGVVVVVAVLAALLFPTFSQAREAARHASCQSNMKQLSMALLMYCQDYDVTMPPKERWQDNLLTYGKNPAIFVCPSDPAAANSYAFNANLSGLSLTNVAAPQSTPTLFESSLHSLNGSDTLQSFDPRHPAPGGGRRGVVGYIDGHVKSETSAPSPSIGPR